MSKPHYRRQADGTIYQVHDGLSNVAARIGVAGDKAFDAAYDFTRLEDEALMNAFRASWACKKAVLLPAQDATRKWRAWTGERQDEVTAAEKQFGLQQKVFQAKWRARLFGGAAVCMWLKDDPREPLDIDRVQRDELVNISVLTRRELTSIDIERDPRLPRFGKPIGYRVHTNSGENVEIHHSRVVEFYGSELPTDLVGHGSLYGWSDSVLQSIYTTAKHLDGAMANIATLIFEAKTDVVKIPNLSSMIMDPRYEEALIRKMTNARLLKGNGGQLILDGEEEYESRSYSFSGLSDVSDRFMQIVSAASDIPMTRFMGQSPGGLNSSGDSDLKNYYDAIQSVQENEVSPALHPLDDVLIRSTLGDRPEDLKPEWRPLMQMTEKEQSETRARDAETVSKLAATQVFEDEIIQGLAAALFAAHGFDQIQDQTE